MFKNLKLKLNQFLEKLAKANQEAYGIKPLSCCDLEKRDYKNNVQR